jgi:hypothetical protein
MEKNKMFETEEELLQREKEILERERALFERERASFEKEKTNTVVTQQPQQVIVNNAIRSSNGVGTAGFVLALIALFFGSIPVFGWILWLLGFILSFAGLFKSPRGLAIAGFVISIIGLILLSALVSAIFAVLR